MISLDSDLPAKQVMMEMVYHVYPAEQVTHDVWIIAVYSGSTKVSKYFTNATLNLRKDSSNCETNCVQVKDKHVNKGWVC